MTVIPRKQKQWTGFFLTYFFSHILTSCSWTSTWKRHHLKIRRQCSRKLVKWPALIPLVVTTDPGFCNHLCLSLHFLYPHIKLQNTTALIPIHLQTWGEDLHLEVIEIYLVYLARILDFPDSEGTFRCLWEEAMQHPKLEQPLINKLPVVGFSKPQDQFQDGLRSAATKVLTNYDLDMDGSLVRSPATVVWSVSNALRSAASLTLNVSGLNSQEEQGHSNLYRPVELELTTHVEPPHSGEIEEVWDSDTITGNIHTFRTRLIGSYILHTLITWILYTLVSLA